MGGSGSVDHRAPRSGTPRQLRNSAGREIEFRAVARGRFWTGSVPVRLAAGASGSAKTRAEIVWRADSAGARTAGQSETDGDQHRRYRPEAVGGVGFDAMADYPQ